MFIICSCICVWLLDQASSYQARQPKLQANDRQGEKWNSSPARQAISSVAFEPNAKLISRTRKDFNFKNRDARAITAQPFAFACCSQTYVSTGTPTKTEHKFHARVPSLIVLGFLDSQNGFPRALGRHPEMSRGGVAWRFVFQQPPVLNWYPNVIAQTRAHEDKWTTFGGCRCFFMVRWLPLELRALFRRLGGPFPFSAACLVMVPAPSRSLPPERIARRATVSLTWSIRNQLGFLGMNLGIPSDASQNYGTNGWDPLGLLSKPIPNRAPSKDTHS